MGSYANQIEVATPPHMLNLSFGCTSVRDTTCLDRCVAEEVQSLWALGVVTTGCCCGHGITTGYIGVEGQESLDIMAKLKYELEFQPKHFQAKYRKAGC